MLRCMLVRILPRNRPNRRYVIYYKELAHTLMEAEKFTLMEAEKFKICTWES